MVYLRRLTFSLGAALAAALYWIIACWACFAASGNDPIDALTVSSFGGRQLASLMMFCGSVGTFGLLMRVRRARRGEVCVGLGWHVLGAAASATYWLGILYVSSGIFLGERMTQEGMEPVAPPWLPWLLIVGSTSLYAVLSAGLRRFRVLRLVSRNRVSGYDNRLTGFDRAS